MKLQQTATAAQMTFDLGAMPGELACAIEAQATPGSTVGLDTVENETGLAVQVVIDVVAGEVGLLAERAGQSRERGYAIEQLLGTDQAFDYVADRTCRLYATKQGKANLKSDDPRPFFYSFVRHWLSSYLKQVDQTAYQLLPESFKIGRPAAQC